MALDGWKERIFRHHLAWRCRPSAARRYLRQNIKARRAAPPDGRRLTVAALQVEVELCRHPVQYMDTMHRRVREAVEAGAGLVVFPEDNNLQLLGMLPGIEQMAEAATTDAGGKAREPAVTVADVVRYVGPVHAPFLQAVFSTLAAAYGVYLMAGSFLLVDDHRVVNRAFLYGPDGALVGFQDKVHLMPIEHEWVSAGVIILKYLTPPPASWPCRFAWMPPITKLFASWSCWERRWCCCP